MARYNKAVGALVGGAIGLGVSVGLLPESAQDPAVVSALTTVFSIAMTYFFPANA